jgi:hypothetical protein
MVEIARLIARVMIHKEDPAKMRPEVIEFRKRYQTLHFVRDRAFLIMPVLDAGIVKGEGDDRVTPGHDEN